MLEKRDNKENSVLQAQATMPEDFEQVFKQSYKDFLETSDVKTLLHSLKLDKLDHIK